MCSKIVAIFCLSFHLPLLTVVEFQNSENYNVHIFNDIHVKANFIGEYFIDIVRGGGITLDRVSFFTEHWY